MPPRRGQGSPELSELVDALQAELYDPDAMRTVLRAPMSRLAQVQGVAVDALAQRIDGMTAAERSEFMERLQAAGEKRRR